MAYKQTQKDQNWLLPLNIKEIIPADHICFLVEKFAELSYNVQLGVSKNQIIVSNDVCQDKHDAHQFIPQIKNIQENIKLNEEIKVGADSGYSDAENIKFALDNEINLYVPFYFRERLWMKEKMNTNESRKIYSLRKITVEPVYGHMKQNLGFREFLLRGLVKVKIEMNIACIAHNLQNTKKSKISCARKIFDF